MITEDDFDPDTIEPAVAHAVEETLRIVAQVPHALTVDAITMQIGALATALHNFAGEEYAREFLKGIASDSRGTDPADRMPAPGKVH